MKTLLGYSLNDEIRYKATSGGVGSSLLKYLFDKRIIRTAVSFDFDSVTLQYVPKLIYCYEDYRLVGSIYHEIKLIEFIKKHIGEIEGGFACFCLPCQAKAIRHLVEKANHKCFLLGLSCSSQQSIEATYYLLKRLRIKKEDVRHLQYRGNGWPSGIQIELRDGKTITVSNNRSVWTQIFHSRLFILPRCFRCNDTLNVNSDISLADPWLAALQENIQNGKTLIMVNTEAGETLWREASQEICAAIIVAESDAVSSQISTIRRKEFYKNHPIKRSLLIKMNKSLWYKIFVTKHPALFWGHNVLKRLLER